MHGRRQQTEVRGYLCGRRGREEGRRRCHRRIADNWRGIPDLVRVAVGARPDLRKGARGEDAVRQVEALAVVRPRESVTSEQMCRHMNMKCAHLLSVV